MNWDLLFAIIFYTIILIFFLIHKKKFDIQGKIFVLYKTKLGLRFMDKVSSKFPKALRGIGFFSVLTAFAGMVFIFYFLIEKTLEFLIVPGTAPPLAPVLPGVQIPGAPHLSFWHWIIAIFIIAVVHELSHGIYARLHKVKINSSGFAFLGPILAAFVEPDEDELKKKSKYSQISVMAAGPFSNLVLGGLFFLLLFFTAPLQGMVLESNGIIVGELKEDYPAMKVIGSENLPFIIKSVNGITTLDEASFFNEIVKIKPLDEVVLETDKGEFRMVAAENPENKTKGFLGIAGFSKELKLKDSVVAKYGNKLPWTIQWINLLILWLFLISIGVGLFNLLPLGPVDGGRIFYLAMLYIVKDESKAKKIWHFVSGICLLLIFINLLPYLIKLLSFIFGALAFLI